MHVSVNHGVRSDTVNSQFSSVHVETVRVLHLVFIFENMALLIVALLFRKKCDVRYESITDRR